MALFCVSERQSRPPRLRLSDAYRTSMEVAVDDQAASLGMSPPGGLLALARLQGLSDPDAMIDRSAKETVQELIKRLEAGDDAAIDELISGDMVNHAAAPQGGASPGRSCRGSARGGGRN